MQSFRLHSTGLLCCCPKMSYESSELSDSEVEFSVIAQDGNGALNILFAGGSFGCSFAETVANGWKNKALKERCFQFYPSCLLVEHCCSRVFRPLHTGNKTMRRKYANDSLANLLETTHQAWRKRASKIHSADQFGALGAREKKRVKWKYMMNQRRHRWEILVKKQWF